MSNRSHTPPWWGYAKSIIRRYHTGNLTQRERDAVNRAIEETGGLPDGEMRLKLIDAVFWAQTHTLVGAALKLNICDRVARKWHGQFIHKVGISYGLEYLRIK